MSAFTYPGVCTLKSFSSDVHIITGVATSYRGIHRLGRPRASRRSHACRELVRLPEYLPRSGFPESARLRGQPVFRQRRPVGLHRPRGLGRHVTGGSWQHFREHDPK